MIKLTLQHNIYQAFVKLAFMTMSCCVISVSHAELTLVPTQIDNIEKTVRRYLDGNVVGYQFTMLQNNKVLREFEYGYSNLSQKIPMTKQRKIDTGSVSKLITAVTILKLYDQKKLDIYEPFYLYLNQNSYPPDQIHETIKMITMYDLLTYTAQLSESDCETDQECLTILQKPRVLENCAVNLEINTPFPYRCNLIYQNAAIHLLRKVIENVLHITNTEHLVAYTYDYWLGNVEGLNNNEDNESMISKMSCTNEGNIVRSYSRCGDVIYNHVEEEQHQCIDGFWHEYGAAFTTSPFCSSGSWRASAHDMARIITALSQGKILQPTTQKLLFHPQLIAGNKTKHLIENVETISQTAISWSPPWIYNDEYNLVKGGASYHARAGVMYIPKHNITIALITNTNDLGNRITPDYPTTPKTVIKTAWRSK